MLKNNSLEPKCRLLLAAFFKDASSWYPHLSSSLKRDFGFCESTLTNRGLPFLLVDLPNIRKILLESLEYGRLASKGPLSRLVSKKTRVPRFLSGLWLRVFDRSGTLKAHPDESAIYLIGQISELFKKLALDCPRTAVIAELEKYHAIEDELPEPTLLWADTEFDWFGISPDLHFCDDLDDAVLRLKNHNCGVDSRYASRILAEFQRNADKISQLLGLYDPYTVTNHVGNRTKRSARAFSHGKGSVSDARRSADKFAFPSWSRRLDLVYDYPSFGEVNYSHTDDDKHYCDVKHSKLIAVPKDFSKPRLIASEPTANQWCQQIMLKWLTTRFKETFIGAYVDLNNQHKSQVLVLDASKSQAYATVDLSSASDRLSAWVIERYFRKNATILAAIQASRTPLLNDPLTGKLYFTKKFATQGTALTFPIQTLVFLTAALTACKWDGKTRIEGLRVYGDDIIIPVEGYFRLFVLLHALGLKVNDDKSFYRGKFRESCGMDAYNGFDVTPSKPRQVAATGPESTLACIDVSNNLFEKGMWNLSAALIADLNDRHLLPITRVGSGDLGLTSFCGDDYSRLKVRWNSDLHKEEYLVLGFKTQAKKIKVDGIRNFFQYLTELPSQEVKWESGILSQSRLLKRRRWAARF